MDVKAVLKELCNAAGVNGEADATQVAKKWLSEYTDDIRVDALGNVCGFISAAIQPAPTVMLEAHIDEIGFVVTRIDDGGFVHVSACGGIDNRTLTATEVVIMSEPPLNGVFCSTPPHLKKGEESLPELSERGIDVGMTKEEAVSRISVGTRVVFRPRFDTLLGNRVCSKALDNRAGVAAILGALEIVKGNPLPVNLVVAFCVQEEVGCRGSMTTAFEVQPNAALIVDVSFATTPYSHHSGLGKLGNGPLIGYSPFLNKQLGRNLVSLADKYKIAVQHEVMGSRTGTDADTIGVSGRGVPCALLSIPLRYMHSPVEVVDTTDVEAVSQLMAAFITEEEALNNV